MACNGLYLYGEELNDKQEGLERDHLLEVASNNKRWFSVEECNRLKHLSNKRHELNKEQWQ